MPGIRREILIMKQRKVRDSRMGSSAAPARWVPKGTLSGFLIQGAAWAFIAQILSIISGVASQIFLARLLSPDVLGVYFLTQSLVLVLANVGSFGLNRPIARYVSADVGSGRVGAARRTVLSAAGIASLSGFGVILVFLAGAGSWIAYSVFDTPLMAVGPYLVALWIATRIALTIGSAVLQGLHRVGLAALFNGALSGTLLAVSCGAMLAMGISVEYRGVIAISAGATLVSALFCIALVWIPFSKVRSTGPLRTRSLVSSALPIFGAGIVQIITLQADLWIVGVQLDASDVALYGAAKRLTVLVGFSLMVLAAVIPPLVSDLYSKGDRQRLQRLVRAATTVASIPAAAVFVLFMLSGSMILELAYGESYVGAATVLKILSAERVIYILMGSGPLILAMTGHEKMVFRITVVSAPISLLTIWVGSRIAGLLGVSLGFAISSVATGMWYWLGTHRRTGIWSHANPLAIRPIAEVCRRML